MSQNLQWQSVLARDSRFDGAFVYAVRSTGIYCRPSCPSRRPQRDRVEFFADPTTAERAGFRACQRCRPETNEADPATAKVIAACKLIESAEEPAFTLRSRSLRLTQLRASSAQFPEVAGRHSARIRRLPPPQNFQA